METHSDIETRKWKLTVILKLEIGNIMKTIKVDDGNIELMFAFIRILTNVINANR